ncbi:MAG: tetratricopeptide repeat protein [Cyclobacteriaceae bacterium]|nr:tetratricopeptide repeat protein [Cyclobacteriaceae bacterium]
MKKLLILLLFISIQTYCQKATWIKKPKEQWPNIAMINDVWFRNGERYVHSSFEYAATGFLINTGKDTLAVTAKHVLWVAKSKRMNTVDLKNDLQRWVMHPKGNPKDSVVIDKLINTDSTEKLTGPNSSILQRDWIVFSTKYVSPRVQPLTPRREPVRPGERVRYFGCPYNDPTCVMLEATVLQVECNKIIFSFPKGANVGGASGSPLVDENGLLIGILGGASSDKATGEKALYAVSTRYLFDILDGKKPLNVPLIPFAEALRKEIASKGETAAMKKFGALKNDEMSCFTYDFTVENINSLGDEYLADNKTDLAIVVYKISAKELSFSPTYYRLGKAYEAKGNIGLAIESYEKAIKLWPDNKEAVDALKSLRERC